MYLLFALIFEILSVSRVISVIEKKIFFQKQGLLSLYPFYLTLKITTSHSFHPPFCLEVMIRTWKSLLLVAVLVELNSTHLKIFLNQWNMQVSKKIKQ